ncbi:hypothetical protein C8Q76DRAFT_715632 [Earliella scabrosa]|nr:hypothetical protein C8Q76DRAFT_715632 [Earliella scabrosa]
MRADGRGCVGVSVSGWCGTAKSPCPRVTESWSPLACAWGWTKSPWLCVTDQWLGSAPRARNGSWREQVSEDKSAWAWPTPGVSSGVAAEAG